MSSPTVHAPDPYAATPLPPSPAEPPTAPGTRSGSTVLPQRSRTASAGRRVSLAVLLVATAVLYLWDLSASAVSDGALRHHAGGLIAFGVGLAVTSGPLWLLHAYGGPSRTVEVAVLVLANAVSTLVRFLALRQLMAHRR